MRERHEEFTERGAAVVAVAPGGFGNDADTYVAKHGTFPFALVVDDHHAVFDAYDVASKLRSLGQRPAQFVVAGDGTVVYNQVGTWQTDIPPIDETLAILDGLTGAS